MAKLDFPDASYSPWVAPNNVIYTYIGTSPNGYWEANTANASTNLTAVFVERIGSTMTGPLISGLSGAGYAYQLNNGSTNLGGLYRDTGSSRLILGNGSTTKIDLQGSSGIATFAGVVTQQGSTLKPSNSSGGLYVMKTDGTTVAAKTLADGSATFAGVGTFSGDLRVQDGGNFRVRTAADATSDAILLQNNGNITASGGATFAGTISTSGQNTINEASALKFSQETSSKSQIRAYGPNASTTGSLEFKVSPTSGTALTPLTLNSDGSTTFTGNVGIGTSSFTATSSGRQILEINGPTSALINFDVGGTRKAYHYADSTDVYSYNTSSGSYRFGTNNTERMRIDSSGNLLINKSTTGTRAANAPLQIKSGASAWGINLSCRSNNDYSYFTFTSHDSNESLANILVQRKSTRRGDLAFATNNGNTGASERMRIDSSGNVGIGLSNISGSGSLTLLAGQAIKWAGPGGSTIYGDIYTSDQNAIVFRNNNSTERMRIDNSGRLLLGMSAARTGFFNTNAITPHFQVETNGPSDNGRFMSLVSNSGASAGYSPTFLFGKSRSTTARGTTGVSNGDELGAISFQGADGNQLVEAARIASQVDGTTGSNDIPGRIMFFTTSDGASSPTERMRLTKYGVMKLSPSGTYSTNALTGKQHEIRNNNNGWDTIYVSSPNANPYGIQINLGTVKNDSTHYFLYCGDTAKRLQINSNGGIQNYQGNNLNLCDEREKKNIVSLNSKWEKVKSWELKKFHYNEDADTDDLRYGVIAQQVENVCPEVLTTWEKQKAADAVLDEDGNVVEPAKEAVLRKGVKEQQMMWIAIKALQEAMEKIETLEAKVAALESA